MIEPFIFLLQWLFFILFANDWTCPHTFHCNNYFVVGVSSDPMLLWIFSNSSFFSSVLIARVLVRAAGQQLKIKPLHFAVFDHPHHFACVESQAIPSKVLNVIVPSSSRSSNWSSPVCLASKACLGSLSWGILLTWPNHLSWDLSIRRSNGSTLRDFRISELRTLINSVTPSIRRKKTHFGRLPLWSHAYGHYPWFMTISENEEKNCFENWGLCFFWRC